MDGIPLGFGRAAVLHARMGGGTATSSSALPTDIRAGGDGAINLFRRRGDADEMDEVGGHDYVLDVDFSDTGKADSSYSFRSEFIISKPCLITSSSLASTSRRRSIDSRRPNFVVRTTRNEAAILSPVNINSNDSLKTASEGNCFAVSPIFRFKNAKRSSLSQSIRGSELTILESSPARTSYPLRLASAGKSVVILAAKSSGVVKELTTWCSRNLAFRSCSFSEPSPNSICLGKTGCRSSSIRYAT